MSLVGWPLWIFTTAVRRHEWRRGTQECVRYARGDFDAKVRARTAHSIELVIANWGMGWFGHFGWRESGRGRVCGGTSAL